ncbi:hypothetical protein BLOT_016365 [Blomia tropicalis]|nr:hypothetical protein BLOT_016365 [Blomia tropicalis]
MTLGGNGTIRFLTLSIWCVYAHRSIDRSKCNGQIFRFSSSSSSSFSSPINCTRPNSNLMFNKWRESSSALPFACQIHNSLIATPNSYRSDLIICGFCFSSVHSIV